MQTLAYVVSPLAARSGAAPGSDESLLVLSDIHLGSDLNDHPQPPGFGRRSARIDADLAKMLDHYRRTPPRGSRWRIVFAGDFIDFIGIAILPSTEHLATEPNAEERAHGLGNASDHAREKFRRVGERHVDVFRALAAFVADGHAVTIVHGNHDVEFHWDAVRDDFRALLASARGIDPALVAEQVEFQPWFYWADGVAYIEHGHQYDAFCSQTHPMLPLSPLDPRRIARGFCEVLLRFVVRPTRGLREHGHENLGMLGYIAFGASLGARGLVGLAVAFVRAIVEMFRVRREWLGEQARALREEHERRVAAFSEARRVDLGRLRALLALAARPITSSALGILGSLLIDRAALALVAMGSIATLALIALRHHAWLWPGVAVVGGAWFLSQRALAKRRVLDPHEIMKERAARLAGLFPAAFVVHGAHAHAATNARSRWRRDVHQRRLVGRRRATRRVVVSRGAHAPRDPPRRNGRRRRVSDVGIGDGSEVVLGVIITHHGG